MLKSGSKWALANLLFADLRASSTQNLNFSIIRLEEYE
jgi:hypothetical protein